MKIEKELEALLNPAHILYDEPMRAHTTFQIGGPAAVYLMPDREELVRVFGYLAQEGVTPVVIGNGSNLLVSDAGIDGVVIEIGKNLRGIEQISESQILDGETVYLRAGAGELLSRVASFALSQGLSGFEFAGGIPGSVGGGVYMNAGAYDGEMRQVLYRAELLTYEAGEEPQIKEVSAQSLALSYRHSALMEQRALVLSATIALTQGDPDEISAKLQELRNRRAEKQPLEYPSAGSAFKRPQGHFAAKLIEDAGLKGYRVGGAAVSEKHSGFIVNLGGASAADVKSVIDTVIERVYAHAGVTLEPEIRMIGDIA